MPSPSIDPTYVIGQLETDHFCHGCGFNLHGQKVWRDERLNMPVCQCPECGRFHNARDGVTAGHRWLERLGVLAAFGWILLNVLCLATLLGVQAGASRSCVEFGTYTTYVSDSELVSKGVDVTTLRYATSYPVGPDSTNVPAHRIRIARDEKRFSDTMFTRVNTDEERVAWVVCLLLLGGVALASGGLAAVALWHQPRLRAAIVAMLPLGGMVLSLSWVLFEGESQLVRGLLVRDIAIFAIIHIVGVAIGLFLGRPFARILANLFLPKRLKQSIAFLWSVDNKPLPTTEVR